MAEDGGHQQERADAIGRGQPRVIDHHAGQGGSDEKTRLKNHRVHGHGVHHQRRRHQTRDQRGSRRPIEDIDEGAKKPESIDVPDLDRAGVSQHDHGRARHQLDNHRHQQYFLAVEGIGDGAGKQAEDDEGQGLQKSGEPEHEGRP